MSAQGFREVLLEELQKERKLNKDTTRSWVFDRLNDEYFEVMGCPRYVDYLSFTSAERTARALEERKKRRKEGKKDSLDRSPDQIPGGEV
jgi:hypothetical protein